MDALLSDRIGEAVDRDEEADKLLDRKFFPVAWVTFAAFETAASPTNAASTTHTVALRLATVD